MVHHKPKKWNSDNQRCYNNALELKKAQKELSNIYQKEQTGYIQIYIYISTKKNKQNIYKYIYIYIYHIDKIRYSVEDRQFRIAWQTVKEVSRMKCIAKAKIKATNQQEQIQLWKQHFKNLFGNPPKVTHEPITNIISKQLDIKLGPFKQEELDSELRKIKNRKAAMLDEIPPELWKTRQFDDILLRHCNAVYNQNTIDRWTNGCIPPSLKRTISD